MVKNLHKIESIRKAVLAKCKGKKVLNIFNRERFGRFTTPSHVAALLDVVEHLRVLHISHDETIDPRLVPLLETGKLEVRFLTPEESDYQCEILAMDDGLFVGDGIEHFEIEMVAFANDLTRMSETDWTRARPMKMEKVVHK